jgi:hypothetical protein
MKKSMQAPVPALFVHDLVNKLAVIVGHCDLVRDHLKEGSQHAKRAGTEELDVARANEGSVVNHCQWGSIFPIRKEFAEG